MYKKIVPCPAAAGGTRVGAFAIALLDGGDCRLLLNG